MENDRLIAFFSTRVGAGNPLAVSAMAEDSQAAGHRTALKITNNPLTWWASWRQSRITNNEDLRLSYNENYHKTRNNWQTAAFGFATLLQLSHFLHKTKANTLVITQELPLTALTYLDSPLIAALLHQLREIILLTPDVHAKPSAVATAQKLQSRGLNLKLAVWNKAAASRLEQQHLYHYLISPWLVPTAAQPLSETMSQVATIRPSGTGINPEYLMALEPFLKQTQKETLVQQVIEERDLVELKKNGKPAVRHRRFFNSLRHALAATLHNNPKLLIGYASELVQAVARFKQMGWRGHYLMLPPRGLHEVENGIYAAMHGLGQTLTFTENRLEVKAGLKTVPTDPIDELVGHQPLSQVLR